MKFMCFALMCLLFAACSIIPEPLEWQHPTATKEEFNRDRTECVDFANRVAGRYPDKGCVPVNPRDDQCLEADAEYYRLYQAHRKRVHLYYSGCMNDRGYFLLEQS